MSKYVSLKQDGLIAKAMNAVASSAKTVSSNYHAAKNDVNVKNALNGVYYYDPIYHTSVGSPSSPSAIAQSAQILDGATPSAYVGGGGSGGGGGSSGNSWEDVMQLISDTARANNEWSAAQAQKQMDFQREMSSTAHQREVEDLQKAGLNPVLSAGGSGASTPSGAMGDTDTSNTRLLAEIASQAVQSLGMTASGYAGAAKAKESGSFLGKLTDLYSGNKLFKKVVDTGLGIGQKVVSYKINKSIATSALRALSKF